MRPFSVVIVAAFTLGCPSIWGTHQPALAEIDDGAESRPGAVTWLSERRAGQIVADATSLGDEMVRELGNLADPTEAAILEDVLDAVPYPSEWRWYPRDRGLLIAAPVRKRLGITETSVGSDAIEAVARRVLERQGHGRPDVRVVFIEPEYPPVARGRAGVGGSGAGAVGAGGFGAGSGAWDPACRCW